MGSSRDTRDWDSKSKAFQKEEVVLIDQLTMVMQSVEPVVTHKRMQSLHLLRGSMVPSPDSSLSGKSASFHFNVWSLSVADTSDLAVECHWMFP